MRMRELATLVLLTTMLIGLPLTAQEAEFKPIFDGKSLSGWEGDDQLWRVENGAIVGQTTEENQIDSNRFLIWNQGEVDDFILKASFRVSGSPKANSGIQFRSQATEAGGLKGYQADIDRSGQYTGIIYSEQTGRGILCQRGERVAIRSKSDKDVETVNNAADLLTAIEMDGWNEMEIQARGNHFTVKINGQLMSDLIDEEADQFRKKGLLGFQLHVGPPMKIEFKDVLLKRLPLTTDNRKVVFIAGTRSHGYGARTNTTPAVCYWPAAWKPPRIPEICPSSRRFIRTVGPQIRPLWTMPTLWSCTAMEENNTS